MTIDPGSDAGSTQGSEPGPDPDPGPAPAHDPVEPALHRRHRRETPAWKHGLMVMIWLYVFLSAIVLMSNGLKMLARTEGSDAIIERMFEQANNPFVALMASVFVTAIVQSSSFTTSMIVAMVGAGTLNVEAAVFAVMGANIGTSVTGVLVALANMRIRRQFRRSFTAALMHDIFNLLTVALLFPLEWITAAFNPEGGGILSRCSRMIAHNLGLDVSADTSFNPVKFIAQPLVSTIDAVVQWLPLSPVATGLVIAILGLALLAIGLIQLVKNLKGALIRRMEGLFRSYFFRNDASSYGVGVVSTVMVQSSTVTTSLMVPLAGAGVVKMRRVFPFLLGANLGTTLTSVIAASAVVNLADTPGNERTFAIIVAIAHISFNLVGTAIWYPLRFVPEGIARAYARVAARSKMYAFGFLFGVFVVIPVVGLLITELLIDSPLS